MRKTMLHCVMLPLVLMVASPLVNAAAPLSASEYIDLAKDCRPAFADAELEEGRDSALRCKGSSGYGLFVYFSAEDVVLTIEDARGDTVFDTPLTLNEYEHGKVEWRIVDGLAFAIIVRIKSYGALEALEIRGIGSHSKIHSSVQVAVRKNENAQSRAEADKAYAAGAY